MPISIQCPSCQTKLNAPDDKAGRKTKCPKCGHAIVVPTADIPAKSASESSHQIVQPEFASSNRGAAAHSLGIASLVVGVFSFFVCWIPLVGIAVASLGLVLGIGGLVLAIVRKGSGVGFPIAGASLSAISLATCVIWIVQLDRTVNAINEAVQQVNGPKHLDAEWIELSDAPIVQHGFEFRFAPVEIKQVRIQSGRRVQESTQKLTVIEIVVENKDGKRKVDFHTWSGRHFTLEPDVAVLMDDLGNTYNRVTFGLGEFPVGGVDRRASLYPNTTVTDILVFEPPLEQATYLQLALPGQNIGIADPIRIRIPMSRVRRID